jgi:hypothetical protein
MPIPLDSNIHQLDRVQSDTRLLKKLHKTPIIQDMHGIPDNIPGLVLEGTSGLLDKLALINHRRVIRERYVGNYVCSGG